MSYKSLKIFIFPFQVVQIIQIHNISEQFKPVCAVLCRTKFVEQIFEILHQSVVDIKVQNHVVQKHLQVVIKNGNMGQRILDRLHWAYYAKPAARIWSISGKPCVCVCVKVMVDNTQK